MIVEASKTYIGNLRAFSTSRDKLALRLRLERTLSHANFHPTWLPASAILCVRKLGGEMMAVAPALSSRRPAPADWERVVAAHLDALARRAVRPALEIVAANAEAVIFNDQAELLACLASDWCGGVETTRWWWQSLFKSREVSAALIPAWLASPEYVPAALEHLSNAAKLIAFARALDDRQARAIRQSVTRKFSLRALEEALEKTALTEGSSQTPQAHVDVSDEQASDGDANTTQPSSRPPWEQFVPQARVEEIGDEQSCMIGTALMLLRAPSTVRSASFAGVVSRWRLGVQTRAESNASAPRNEHALARTSDFTGDQQGERRNLDEEHNRVLDDESNKSQRTINDAAQLQFASPVASKEITSPIKLEDRVQRDAGESRADSGETSQTEGRTPSQPEFSTFVQGDQGSSGTQSQPLPASAPSVFTEGNERAPQAFIESLNYEARIRTEFGGVFYLINLGLFLNLYGDFTTPLTSGIDLPVWDFLALVGVELCGERIRRDPVWPLLAQLSGRDEQEQPGAGFAPPESWRVPPEWLAAFPERRAWKWKAEEGRLRVLHPRGFLILDVPLAGDPREQLKFEMAAYPNHFRSLLRRASFDAVDGTAGTIEGWLNHLLPYVRARLSRALGVRKAGTLRRLVCEHRAQVSVTATHLEVTFALARLPLEVRLAGLDRNPGWVPAAGRYIAFHYE